MSASIFLYDNIPSRPGQKGVTRYFEQVADGIILHFGVNATIFSSQRRNYGVAKHLLALPMGFRGSGHFKVNLLLGRINDNLARFWANRTNSRVVFSAYYGNIQTKAAKIFTVYDMMHELLPQYYDPNLERHRKIVQQKKQCFEQADLLLAISHNTAQDIVSYYPHISPDKILTTHLGVDDVFFTPSNSLPSHYHKPYFLYVGNRSLYKNFIRLLTAFHLSGLAKDFDLRVISPTKEGFSQHEKDYLQQYNLDKSVHLMNAIKDTTLRDSYANAIALVYPSEYEGFGLPILEAMASGTLVATSNTASMPELGEKIAFYFDPYSAEAIAESLRQIASFPFLERQLRLKQGMAHAREFSWLRCQQQTIDAIQRLW